VIAGIEWVCDGDILRLKTESLNGDNQVSERNNTPLCISQAVH
jgi:hypothetical protein